MDVQRRTLLRLTSLSAALVLPRPGSAEPDASQPVRILVGFPPGGPLDIAARTVAPLLSSRLGTEVVVDNRPGESGNLATAEVARAAPDGRSLLLCGPVNAINTSLFTGLDFDFVRDIEPVALIASVPLVLEVNAAVPVRSVPELLAYVRGHPGRLRVAFAGIGTPQHIAIAQFEALTGTRITLVPFAGSVPALAALLGGGADAMFDPVPSSLPHIAAGRLVPLATTGATRLDSLPAVPTLGEFVRGYEAGSWFGLGAPRQTPASIIDRLNAAINDSLGDAAVASTFRTLGATVAPSSPAEFGQFIAAETEKYRRIITQVGIERP